jgi:hypothetical protein
MATKKTNTKKSTAKKSNARKTTAKKSTARKASAKKSPAKKSSGKKAIAVKAVERKLIKRSTLTFLTESLPGFTVGRPKKFRIQAVGGTPPYSFGLSQGSALPAGLNLNYQGILFGTPTQSGDTTIFVKLIDFVGANVTSAFDLQIS